MLETFQHVKLNDGAKFISYAAVCVVCLKKITEFKLQKCSGCKLVFYCSKEHQKSHWPIHKELCKAIQLMIKKTGNVGLFDDYVDEGFALWVRFTRSLIYVCERIIKRKLCWEESALFLNPFSCKICHVHKPNRMITCKDCCVVSYCSEEHQLKDKFSHSLVCCELKFCLDFDINCNTPFCLSTCVSDVSMLPNDMKTFIDRCVEIKTEPYVSDLYVGCYISNFLTLPLTLIYVIEKSNVDLRKESLRVHIVGSGQFEGLGSWYWEYIFHYFKTLRVMNFVFVGPESSVGFLPPILTCKDCINYRSINFVLENDLYHDYVNRVTESPDIIIAYNCGFHEFKHLTQNDTWKKSIPALCCYPDVVVAFTSYQQDESEQDIKFLKEFSNNDNLNVLVECQENPFRSLMPFHDWYHEDGCVYYNNNFISILTT